MSLESFVNVLPSYPGVGQLRDFTCSPQVPLDSIASHSGCKSGDYLVKIADKDVFDLGHEEAKDMIRRAGNRLSMVLERGEKIVPSMNSAFPKQKSDEPLEEKAKTYSQMVRREK